LIERLGEPGEAAAFAVYPARGEVSYGTGANFVVNGGVTAT
jgi:NAD(P)-dependent dehydrogenase (short-subunit alcohol dehydrogenase family)